MIPGRAWSGGNSREELQLEHLGEHDADRDPFKQFALWFEAAVAAHLYEPEAMVLATATPDGKPSARTVLLKGFDERGFIFYTNYGSRKGRELIENPWASAVFLWAPLHRQVRIEGCVHKVSDEESDAYYNSRPLGSRLGAWASPQSQVIPNRDVIDNRMEELITRYGDQPPPRPPYWGGFRLQPASFEFWQGRTNRLHDRLSYRHDEAGGWLIERLSP